MGMGQRASHYDTIPLCYKHHQGGGYGIAIHSGAKTWIKKYGTEEELIEQVKQLLEEEDAKEEALRSRWKKNASSREDE